MEPAVRNLLLLGQPRETKIYGVSWGKVASPTLTRTDAAVGMVANAGVDAGVVVNNFDTAEIYRDIVDVTDALGNVFVRIPKFYIEKTSGATATWRISRTPFSPTCYLPKCFGSDGYAYIGKYNASLDGGGTKLCSLSGTYPLINKTIVNNRGYAQANGAGYQQMDIHAVDLLQTLFLVEFATLNSQSIMAGWMVGNYSAGSVATATENAANRVVQNELTDLQTVVEQLSGELRLCEFWQAGFKRARLFYIKRIIAVLEAEINSVASVMGLHGWYIAVRVETENKSGTLKHGVQIEIKSPESTAVWEAWSGGESQRLRVALSVGPANLIERKTGVSYNFEVWDEPSNWLSEEGIEDLLEMLEYRALTTHKSIYMMDHRVLSYAGFTEVINAVKDENGTRLVIEGN